MAAAAPALQRVLHAGQGGAVAAASADFRPLTATTRPGRADAGVSRQAAERIARMLWQADDQVTAGCPHPELGDQLAPPALGWLHSRGWQLHPGRYAPAIRDSRQHQAPCAMTLKILHQSLSQA